MTSGYESMKAEVVKGLEVIEECINSHEYNLATVMAATCTVRVLLDIADSLDTIAVGS